MADAATIDAVINGGPSRRTRTGHPLRRLSSSVLVAKQNEQMPVFSTRLTLCQAISDEKTVDSKLPAICDYVCIVQHDAKSYCNLSEHIAIELCIPLGRATV
jgi:hypothetical protein